MTATNPSFSESLNAIFGFGHLAPSELQNEQAIQQFLDWISAFTSSLEPCPKSVIQMSSASVHFFNGEEIGAIQGACDSLKAHAKGVGITAVFKWYPDYGAVLLETFVRPGYKSLTLLGLDGWKFEARCMPNNKSAHSAVPTSSMTYPMWLLPDEIVDEIVTVVVTLLGGAAKRKKDERSAAEGRQGHQKTPAFLAAIINEAVNQIALKHVQYENESHQDHFSIEALQNVTFDGCDGNYVARGGTTDVGLHTGSKPRETSWALVDSALKYFLEDLYEKFLVHFHLFLLEIVINAMETKDKKGKEITANDFNVSFEIFDVTVAEILYLCKDDYEVELFGIQPRFVSLHQRLLAVQKKVCAHSEKKSRFELTLNVPWDKYLDLNLEEIDTCLAAHSKPTHDEILQRSWSNIDSVSVPKANNMKNLLNWAKTESKNTLRCYSKLLCLEHMNKYFFSQASNLSTIDAQISDDDLNETVQLYHSLVNAWLGSDLADHHELFPMIRSHETLVVWIAFCLHHRRMLDKYPLLEQYAMPLNPDDLKVLFLKDQRAVNAMIDVCDHIRAFNAGKSLKLFSLSETSGTFDFALKFAQSSTRILEAWRNEVSVRTKRLDQHKVKLQDKKRKLGQFRANIHQERSNLDSLRSQLAESVYQSYNYYDLNKLINSSIKDINYWERKVEEQNKMPSHIIEPLPESKEKALIVLFFFLMPNDLDILGRLSVDCWQMLVPRSPWKGDHDIVDQVAKMIKVTVPCTWTKHYSTFSNLDLGKDRYVLLFMDFYELPRSVGPQLVDHCTSSEQCRWYPSNFGFQLVSESQTHPSKITTNLTRLVFTLPMPHPMEAFQWVIRTPDSNAEKSKRGNLIYTKLDKIPKGFSKSAFIAFGSLRSFPIQQMRKMISILLDKLLPFDHPAAMAVMRQTMFEVGPIASKDSKYRLVWKTDLMASNGIRTMTRALENLASELKETPRNFMCVQVLIELAAYLAHFSDDSSDILKEFRNAAKAWLHDLDKEMDRPTLPHKEQHRLGAQQFNVIGLYLLAFEGETMTKDLATDYLGLLLRFCYMRAYADGGNFTDELQVKVAHVAARHCEQLHKDCFFSDVLTNALRTVLQKVPDNLSWNKYTNYYVVDAKHEENIYMINLLNGRVLFNGNPPSRLPGDILSHSLFQSTFGDRDFDVRPVTGGALQTVRSFNGKYYEFLKSDTELSIREIEVELKKEFYLLDPKIHSKWFLNLPIRLQEMHSAWFCEADNLIIIRQKFIFSTDSLGNYREKITALVVLDEDNVPVCFDVPAHKRHLPWEFLVSDAKSMDKFVKVDYKDPIIQLLCRIEKAEFLHSLIKPTGQKRVHLPRFGLNFIQDVESKKWFCDEHREYFLDRCQMLASYLPQFQQYLVLTHNQMSGILRKLVIPNDDVVFHTDKPTIVLAGNCDAKCSLFIYDVDAYQDIMASTVESRLHLALIFSAFGLKIPDISLGCTGAEAAIELVRKCWVNRQLTKKELRKLEIIPSFAYQQPALVLTCLELLETSNMFCKLFNKPVTKNNVVSRTAYSDATLKYTSMVNSDLPWNEWHRTLTKRQEFLLFGHEIKKKNVMEPSIKLFLSPYPVPDGYVMQQEKAMMMEVTIPAFNREATPFPWQNDEISVLESEIDRELKESWDTFHQNPSPTLQSTDQEYLRQRIEIFLKDATEKLKLMDEYLVETFRAPQATSLRLALLYLSNRIPRVTRADYFKIAFDDEALEQLTFFLDETGRLILRNAVLLYLQLEIFVARLDRIRILLSSDRVPLASVVQEWTTVRQWDPRKHPEWLVFEAEGLIQIRPEQFKVANHIIHNPGAITQLNMGCGKTRVILPMLVLYFCLKKNRSNLKSLHRIVRLHFLTALLREAAGYLHLRLTASTFNLPFLEVPFSREVDINCLDIQQLDHVLQMIQRYGGCILCAPEHRLSLSLKLKEFIYEKNSTLRTELLQFFEKWKFLDILDESDALLSHKYHLMYAMGNAGTLEDCLYRAYAVQGLLAVLNNSDEVCYYLNQRGVSVSEHIEEGGRYRKIRLVQKMSETTAIRQELVTTLLESFIEQPPYSFRWISDFVNAGKISKETFVSAITNYNESINIFIGCEELGENYRWQHLLILRGLLGSGLLEYALELRANVNYGIDTRRKKRLAVPYQAADMPSERSEFGHPDLSLILTMLAYYHIGLTKEQMFESLQYMLSLSIDSQRYHYQLWFEPISNDLFANGEREKMDDVVKIDLNNVTQQELLYSKYRYSTEAINFWLNNCVFPVDLGQFPENISASAWHLAEGDWQIGFSGTNDTHLLYPARVVQNDPDCAHLRGTNGKMLHYLIEHTLEYRATANYDLKIWQSALWESLQFKNIAAVIDTGSVLAGVSNAQVAMFLIEQENFPSDLLGVLYFELKEQNGGQWMMLDKKTGLAVTRQETHILERDAFIVFDEARSRGTDMKMRPHAVASLIIGPNLTKDRLMQGAGRLRQLSKGQRIVMLAPPDVDQLIKQQLNVSTVSASTVMHWVSINTQSFIASGLTEWAMSGLAFAKSSLNTVNVAAERSKLEELYLEGQSSFLLSEKVQQEIEKTLKEQEPTENMDVLEVVKSRCQTYGNTIEIKSTGFNYEVERELALEREKEMEQENEIEYPPLIPITETPWQYAEVMKCKSVPDISKLTTVLSMDQVFEESISLEGLEKIEWDYGRLYCTEAFLETIKTCERVKLDYFVRPADGFIKLPDDDIVLLSDQEMDGILGVALKKNGPIQVGSHVPLRSWIDTQEKGDNSPMTVGVPEPVCDKSIAALQLFNGETMYQGRKESLEKLTADPGCRRSLMDWVNLRGLVHYWKFSDLEQTSLRII